MLSGGQRQRVALARGLYRDFDLLLLDDVLSAVDHDTEQRLIAALQARSQAVREGRGRPTTLLVSHRVSAMRHADRILVLDAGRLVDSGSHQELVSRGGPYRDAWLYQSRELQSQERNPQEQGP
jgi:ATP-binding cassette subfamily B protein